MPAALLSVGKENECREMGTVGWSGVPVRATRVRCPDDLDGHA